MNSCLQSLLTLEDFINDLSSQEQVWSRSPGTEVLRYRVSDWRRTLNVTASL